MTRVNAGRLRVYRFWCLVLAYSASRKWTLLAQHHMTHTEHPSVRASRLKAFQVALRLNLVEWLAAHRFDSDGAFMLGGEYHPDARLMWLARQAGMPNTLDAFPPHTVMHIRRSGVRVEQLAYAA